MTILTFLLFLLLFVVIGLFSIKHSKKSSSDYLLAGHSVKPWLVGLSAVATNNSGYMFIGMIGYTYMVGLSSIWLMIGWIIGDFIGSLIVHRKLREKSEELNAHSFGGILSHWMGEDYKNLRKVVGLITVLFLATYSAAQLNAGSKALHSLFGWEESLGAIIGAVIILLYSYAGGIRASIWTDAAQSIVMIISMFALIYISISSIGGVDTFFLKLSEVNESYLNWFEADSSTWDKISFVIGWIFGGFAVIGQPHIMIRFMTMDSPSNINRVRLYYYSWFILFYGLTVLVGLATRLYIPAGDFDAELALPTLSTMLMHPILVGMILAGIFSATISTADSLVLSCSASLSRDFTKEPIENYYLIKIGTVAVTLFALSIALFSSGSVFALVLDAWGVLAGAFAPLLTLYALNQVVRERLAILMVISGVLTIYIWKYFIEIDIYEVAPAILVGFLTYYIFRKSSLNR